MMISKTQTSEVDNMDDISTEQQLFSRRKFLLSGSVVAGSILFSSCDIVQNTPTTITTNTTNKYTLGLILGSQNEPFYRTLQKGAQAKATELGIKLFTDAPAHFDANLQIPLVEAMITKKVDVLIIAACDKQLLIEPLKHAHDAGIAIISVDTFIGDGDYTRGSVTFPLTYIGSDNIEGGRIIGAGLIKNIGGEGKVYIQNVTPGISTTDQRAQGFTDAIQATNGAVTLVGMDYNYDTKDKAINETVSTMQRVTDLAGIFGTNVSSGEGAAVGVKRANKQGAVKIANFDAPEQAITDIRNGVIDLVIAQKPGGMGSIAVTSAFQALTGNSSTIKKRISTSFFIIDKNNVDTPEAQSATYKNS